MVLIVGEWKEEIKGSFIRKLTNDTYEIVTLDYQDDLEEDDVFFVQVGIFNTNTIDQNEWCKLKEKLTKKLGFEPNIYRMLIEYSSLELYGFVDLINGMENINNLLKNYDIEPLKADIKLNQKLTPWEKADIDLFIRCLENENYEAIKIHYSDESNSGVNPTPKRYTLLLYKWNIGSFGSKFNVLQIFSTELGKMPKDDLEVFLYGINFWGKSATESILHFEKLEELNQHLNETLNFPFLIEKSDLH